MNALPDPGLLRGLTVWRTKLSDLRWRRLAHYGVMLWIGAALHGLAFPLDWGLYLFVAIGLVANFTDLKDIEGDRADGMDLWAAP